MKITIVENLLIFQSVFYPNEELGGCRNWKGK